jgi:gamma-glutamyltranspeptidase
MERPSNPGNRIALETSNDLVFDALIVLCLVLALSCATVKESSELEGAGPVIRQLDAEVVQSPFGMVATALLDASRIAVEILESGGTAASTRIPGVVATVISNIIDRRLELREAILAPRIL